MGYGKKQNEVTTLSPHKPWSLIRLQAPKCYFSLEEASEQRSPLPSLLMGHLGSVGDGSCAPKSVMHWADLLPNQDPVALLGPMSVWLCFAWRELRTGAEGPRRVLSQEG